MIELNTQKAHVFIPATTGAGKTTLAKIIIQNNKPDALLVLSPNNMDWKNAKTDINLLKVMFDMAKKKGNQGSLLNSQNEIKSSNKNKLGVKGGFSKTPLYIVVFDDFNNIEGVNMWTNKLVRSVFTEGRKYNMHCILISHTISATGNQIRDMCYYTVLFKPKSLTEMKRMAIDYMLGDFNQLSSLFTKCTSRFDFVLSTPEVSLPVRPDKQSSTFHDLSEQNFFNLENLETSRSLFNPSNEFTDRFNNVIPFKKLPQEVYNFTSSENVNNLEKFETLRNGGYRGVTNPPNGNNISSNFMNSSNNSVSNNIHNNNIQTFSLENRNLMNQQHLKYTMSIKELEYDRKIKMKELEYTIIDLVLKQSITLDEKNHLISLLNTFMPPVSERNWEKAVLYFQKRKNLYQNVPKISHQKHIFNELLNSPDAKTTALKLFSDYSGLITNQSQKFLRNF